MVAEREQRFLLPPDMRDWLPEEHLAWFVIEVVDQVDLTAFRNSYRADGHGRAAYDPAMVVAILLYGYALEGRSSREIEQRCRLDIAFRVLAGGHTRDHTTFARFRQRHQNALAGVLVESLPSSAGADLSGRRRGVSQTYRAPAGTPLSARPPNTFEHPGRLHMTGRHRAGNLWQNVREVRD